MGDHLTNPHAVAKQQGGQAIGVYDLGDGIALAGFELRPQFRKPRCTCPAAGEPAEHEGDCASLGEPVAVACLYAVGGRVSVLSVKVELTSVLLGEIGSIPVANLKRLFTEAPKAGEPAA
jgi:hypothetical protein